ncbi:hypothetical protein [Frankia sp. R82]|uniref:hypothetical protein n=1 Tax=Frankia sp. R82 TaxID=2950553 RepID=UPI0020430F6F|nr:hypothetical protein [Frankia sp. R82]MCM3882269.1 hypothetical protein [Frankia sp. R82]
MGTGTGAGAMSGPLIVGVDAGCVTLHDADLLVHRLVEALELPADTVACTHTVGAGTGHVALSFALPVGWRDQAAWRRVAYLAGDLAAAELTAARRAAAGLGRGTGAAAADLALTGFVEVEALIYGPVGVATAAERIGPPVLADGAAQAVADHTERQGGRAVVYPGVSRLRGTVSVETVLGQTAVGRVVAPVGQAAPRRSDLLRTRNHVRPVWRDGVLTLHAAAERGRVFAPSEVPPTSESVAPAPAAAATSTPAAVRPR